MLCQNNKAELHEENIVAGSQNKQASFIVGIQRKFLFLGICGDTIFLWDKNLTRKIRTFLYLQQQEWFGMETLIDEAETEALLEAVSVQFGRIACIIEMKHETADNLAAKSFSKNRYCAYLTIGS